jgi:hypothetical protein
MVLYEIILFLAVLLSLSTIAKIAFEIGRFSEFMKNTKDDLKELKTKLP